jgi:hypothetical protein
VHRSQGSSWVLGDGIEKKRARLSLGVDYFVFFLSLLFGFVKGDSHPKTGAQRTDEGGGFLYGVISLVQRVDVGAPRRGPSAFPLATYPLGIEAVKRDSFIRFV